MWYDNRVLSIEDGAWGIPESLGQIRESVEMSTPSRTGLYVAKQQLVRRAREFAALILNKIRVMQTPI